MHTFKLEYAHTHTHARVRAFTHIHTLTTHYTQIQIINEILKIESKIVWRISNHTFFLNLQSLAHSQKDMHNLQECL